MKNHQKKIIWHLLSNRWNSAISEYCFSAVSSISKIDEDSKNILFVLNRALPQKRAVKKQLDFIALKNFSIFRLFNILRVAKKLGKPDIIITYGGQENTLSIFLKKIFKIKIYRFYGQEIKVASLWERIRLKFSHLHVEKVIAPSKIMQTKWQGYFAPTFLETITLGVDETKYFQKKMEASSKVTILNYGRFDPIKGHKEMFRIFKEALLLWQNEKNLFLQIVGLSENVKSSDLLIYAKSLGLKDKEDFEILETFDPAIEDKIRRAHLGWIPSLGSEIICRTAEEYLLCGTPIFVSGVGSLNEYLIDDLCKAYQGLDEKGAALLLIETLQKIELEKKDEERSLRAFQSMSYKAMGQSLRKLIKTD